MEIWGLCAGASVGSGRWCLVRRGCGLGCWRPLASVAFAWGAGSWFRVRCPGVSSSVVARERPVRVEVPEVVHEQVLELLADLLALACNCLLSLPDPVFVHVHLLHQGLPLHQSSHTSSRGMSAGCAPSCSFLAATKALYAFSRPESEYGLVRPWPAQVRYLAHAG